MRNILIFIIQLYRKIISPFLDALFGPGNGCRFEETCSEYSIRVIKEYGVLRGVFLSLIRLSRCHPFSKASLKYESI